MPTEEHYITHASFLIRTEEGLNAVHACEGILDGLTDQYAERTRDLEARISAAKESKPPAPRKGDKRPAPKQGAQVAKRVKKVAGWLGLGRLLGED